MKVLIEQHKRTDLVLKLFEKLQARSRNIIKRTLALFSIAKGKAA